MNLFFQYPTDPRAYIVICPSNLIAGNEETILVINDKNDRLKGEIVLEDNPNFHKDDPYDAHTVDVKPGGVSELRGGEKASNRFLMRTLFSGLNIAHFRQHSHYRS